MNNIIPFPNKKYQIIYADPPWKPLESGGGKPRGTANLKLRYKGVMTTAEICGMPLNEIAATDCILFLWCTFPRLEDGIQTIKSWGFKYYGLGFTWIKTNKRSDTLFLGMGYYTRQNPEVCLIGVKGKRFKPLVRNIHSVIMSPIDKHSAKPPKAREDIVKIIGDIPRIELFARERVEGWDAWGNEV